MMESFTAVGVCQPWYLVIFELYILLIIVSRAKYIVLCKLYKARVPARPLDLTFGFGLLYGLLNSGRNGYTPRFVTEILSKTGKRSALFKLAGRTTLFTTEPENIKAILATQFDDFVLGSRHECISVLLGDGIFTLDGDSWKHSRAMLRPQFAREQVAHIESLESHVQKLIQQIHKTNRAAFDIQPLFFALTVDSGTDFLFGQSCDSLSMGLESSGSFDEEGLDPELRRLFPEAFTYSQKILRVRVYLQKLYWLATNKRFRECNKIVHDFTDFFVQKALAASEEEIERNSRKGYIFLYALLKETRDAVVLRDQCLNILLAARDTTAALLAFTFFELARNPKIFETLRASVTEDFGEGENADLSLVTFESLKKCEYLKWVLNEALRMYPPVPRNSRIATKNTTLPRGGGPDQMSPIFIEKGTVATYAVYSLQRDKKYYGPDASVFRPERWSEPNLSKLGWAYLPFNGGPRICLGQQYALTEASYVIVRLLQTFKGLKSFDTHYPPRFQMQLSMCLMDGARVSLE